MNRITLATHVTMAEELSAHITQLANLVTGLAEELKEFKQEVRSGQTRDGGDPDPSGGDQEEVEESQFDLSTPEGLLQAAATRGLKGKRTAKETPFLPVYELGAALPPGFSYRPVPGFQGVGVFDIGEEPVYRHLAAKGHTASASEFLIAYVNGYFLSCADAAFSTIMASPKQPTKEDFASFHKTLSAHAEFARLRVGYLRTIKSATSTVEDRAFGDLIHTQFFEPGTEHLGSETLTQLKENYQYSMLQALHTATAKKAASLKLAGGFKNKDKDREDKNKDKDNKKKEKPSA